MKKQKTEKKYRNAGFLAEPLRLLPDWYEKNGRDLPWRRTKDPYDVWISEIMCQQTRISAVIEYYRRFREELPDVRSLAAVDDDRLMKLWEGLGYYSRARNLKRAARIIMEKYGGVIPTDPKQLEKLPGIGSYTAGAVASIAGHVPVPSVDGNVLRICSRLAGNDDDVMLPATKKALESALSDIMADLCVSSGANGASIPPGKRSGLQGSGQNACSVDPGVLNQAMMELGEMICLPNGAPLCGDCPVRECCCAGNCGAEEILPFRSRPKKRRVEKRTVLLIQNGETVLIRKRPEKGLLAGLWEFPSAEGFLDEKSALGLVREIIPDGSPVPLRIEKLGPAKHIFSHVEWRMRAYRIRLADPCPDAVMAWNRDGMKFVGAAELSGIYSMPAAFEVYRKEIQESLSSGRAG